MARMRIRRRTRIMGFPVKTLFLVGLAALAFWKWDWVKANIISKFKKPTV